MAKATYLLRKAGELVKERNYQEAVEVYLQATETDPSDARAWFGLGVCLYKVDNLDVAHIALERALKMGYPRAQDALNRVEGAEKRRAAEGKGAKATVAPIEAKKRAAAKAPPAKEPPPRPAVRPEEEKIDLDRYLRVMLIENIESDRAAIARAIEGTIKHAEVAAVDYGMSTSDTMSGTVHFDAAVLDWDTAPDAAAGLIHILKIKRPSLMVLCLTEKWLPETAVEIFEAGADYHLVKERHFASAIPLVLAQWARRDAAVCHEEAEKGADGSRWPAALDALGIGLLHVSADLTVCEANQAAMKRLRRGEDELVGRSYSSVFYGQEEPPESCPVIRVLEKGEAAEGEVHVEGLEAPLHVRAWPVAGGRGRVGSAVAAVMPDGEGAGRREPHALYRSLVDKANVGLAMVGTDGRFLYVNQGLCTMLDQTEDELIGQPIESLVPPQEQQTLREALQGAVEEGRSGERIVLQQADGSTFAAEMRTSCFAAGDGTHLVVTLMGVQELEQAEQELWSEAGRLAVVLDEGVDRLACGVVVLDGEGRVTWLNRTAAETFGAGKDELLERGYLELMAAHLEDGRQLAEELREAHGSGAAVEARPARDAEGSPLTYWSTPVAEGGTSSVSRVEHFYFGGAPEPIELPEGEDGLPAIAAAIPEMFFTADLEGSITWCSPAARATAGYSEADLRGKALSELADEEGRAVLAELTRKAAEQNGPVRMQLPMLRKGGGRFWAELTMVATGRQNGEEPSLQGVVRDITDRKVAEAIRELLEGRRPV